MIKGIKNCLLVVFLLASFILLLSPIVDQCEAGKSGRNFITSDDVRDGSDGHSVPEPATLFLLAAGGGALYLGRRLGKK